MNLLPNVLGKQEQEQRKVLSGRREGVLVVAVAVAVDVNLLPLQSRSLWRLAARACVRYCLRK